MGIFKGDKDKSKGREEVRQDSIETSGKTVEKALEKGLETLLTRIDEVEIKIVDPGQKGLLGIFGTRD